MDVVFGWFHGWFSAGEIEEGTPPTRPAPHAATSGAKVPSFHRSAVPRLGGEKRASGFRVDIISLMDSQVHVSSGAERSIYTVWIQYG